MEFIKLKCGASEAIINLSRGANCISLKNTEYNADILRTPSDIENPDGCYLYGMPILFPVNRISGGRFEFEGREYVFPINEPKTNSTIHGDICVLPFCCKEKSESRAVCVFENRSGSYWGFPHDFTLTLTYTLTECGLKLETAVENHSDSNMPIFLGYHTTFNIPFIYGSDKDDALVLCEVSDEIERNMTVYLPTGRILPTDDITSSMNRGEFSPLCAPISRHYKIGGNGRIELYDKKSGVTVEYKNDISLGWRLIYNGKADEYICLEPQTCMANCANAPFSREYSGFDYLKPYETRKYNSEIIIRKDC